MNRVIAYIDGFNLYHGMRSKDWRKYYWLDVVELSRCFLKQSQRLDEVHYFTSRILPRDGRDSAMRRQICYLDALESLPLLSLHFGRFLEKASVCRHCGGERLSYEEKMTDVNIATKMLVDAFDDQFDTALLVSADSDFTTLVRVILSRFPEKRIIAVRPPGRHSEDLKRTATANLTIDEASLRSSQLPLNVTSKDGYVLIRPKEWN